MGLGRGEGWGAGKGGADRNSGHLRKGWGAPKGCLPPKMEMNYLPLAGTVRAVGF